MNLRETVEKMETLTSEMSRLFLLVMASESNTFLKRVKAKIPSDAERQKARSEINALGGRHAAWTKFGDILAERERIKHELQGHIRRTSLKDLVSLLDEDLYNRLIENAGGIRIWRLAPTARETGTIPPVGNEDLKAVVRELGGGKYQIEYSGVEEFEGRRDVLEFGGEPKCDDLMEVLFCWGLKS